MSPRLALALDAVYRAGRLTLRYFNTGAAIDYKEDQSPVTVADREAEQLIRDIIAAKFPNDPILGEEQGGDTNARTRWVIDPIDGTKSFIAGVPLYATLLSYELDGEPVIGACYLPALDELIYAERGQGTFWNGRPSHVSTKDTLEQSTICAGSMRSFADQGSLNTLVDLTRPASALRTWCDAYGHILVATGRAEAMIDPVVKRWDISSLAIITREAGGTFTDFRGNAALSTDAISSNGKVHPFFLEALKA